MNNPEIRFINNHDVDRDKWDKCISISPFGISYAYSWYLDRICSHWDALIWGDYLYVMPLVNNKKFGFSYIYQPFFTQQLGIFSHFTPEPEIVNQFLHAIPDHFRLIDMKLNLGNKPGSSMFLIQPNTTFHLQLGSGVDPIRYNYNSNTKRNIQKAIQHKVFISPVYDIPQFLKFTQENLKEKSPEIKAENYAAFQKAISHALYNQFGEIYGAWDSGNNLIAAVFFLHSNHMSIYLAATSTAAGINQSAMFLLIDTFIQKHSGEKRVLDFEGSNIAGIARFYSGFGAQPQTYYSIHQNRLPKLLQLFKK